MPEDTSRPVRGVGRREIMVSAVVLMVLALVALLAWRIASAQVRDEVAVGWSGPVACTGTTVDEVRHRADGREIPVVRLREGMRCTVPVQVSNDSAASVTVTRVVLPIMGPSGTQAVRVVELEGASPTRLRATDAVFRPGRRVEPGKTYGFDVELEFRPPPAGCTERGLLVVEGLPRVTVLALGRAGVVRAEETIGFRGTAPGACSR